MPYVANILLTVSYNPFTAVPHEEERKILHDVIPQPEFDALLGVAGEPGSAGDLLGVRSNEFELSIRHNVVRDLLQNHPTLKERGVTDIPLAVQRRPNNPDYFIWTGCDTILGKQVNNPNFELLSETKVSKLLYNRDAMKVDGAVLRDLNTHERIIVKAKVWSIYYY